MNQAEDAGGWNWSSGCRHFGFPSFLLIPIHIMNSIFLK